MNSLFTSTLSPVAFSLGLLLLVATAFPAPAPLGEDSKDNITSMRALLTLLNKTENLTQSIFFEISKVRNKMCGTDDACKNVMEALAGNNLNLPKMAEKDGCFQAGFHEETCLMKITTGLLEFQIYLEFLKDNYKENAEAMQSTTKVLFHNLKQMIKNPDEVTTPDPIADSSLLAQMQSQTEWLKSTTVRLILKSLEMFLQYTLRAARSMYAEQLRRLL